MRGFFLKISQFIKGIRRSDDRTKKRWLVAFSSIAIIFVIALWIAYLNVTLPQSTGIPTGTSTEIAAPIAEPKEEGRLFFKTLGAGWNMVWDSIEKNISGIGSMLGESWLKFKNQLGRTNELELEKPAATPTPTQNFETVPPTLLP